MPPIMAEPDAELYAASTMVSIKIINQPTETLWKIRPARYNRPRFKTVIFNCYRFPATCPRGAAAG
jgi:hypothetical protein